MKKLFQINFLVFIVTGFIFTGFIVSAVFNELFLKLFGPLIFVPENISNSVFLVLKIIVPVMFISFPGVIISIFVRGWKDRSVNETKSYIFLMIFFTAIFFILPTVLLTYQHQYKELLVYLSVISYGLILGGKGREPQLPICWK